MNRIVVRSLAAVAVGGLLAVAAVVAPLGGVSPAGLSSASSSPPSPTGSLVYAGAGDSGLQLFTHDLSADADAALPNGELPDNHPGSTTVSPDGSKIAVRSGNISMGDDIHIYDMVTRAWTWLVGVTDASAGEPAWLPDSQHLVVQLPDGPDYLTSALWIYALDGTRRNIPGTRLSNNVGITSCAVSPSGLQIAYSRRVSGVNKVFVMNVDGTSPTALGITGTVEAWMHDGAHLLVKDALTASDGQFGGSVLRTATPRGGTVTTLPLTYTSTYNLRSTLSPDDAWLTLEPEVVQNVYASRIDVVPTAGGAIPVTALSAPNSLFGASYLGAWTATDSTAPTMTPVTGTLGPTSATLSWSPIQAADSVGVRVSVSLGLVPPASYAAGARRVTVLGRATRASFAGLTAGATYSYSAWALDGAGNESTPVTGHFRLVPAATVAAPGFASTVSSVGVPVRYSSAGGGTAGVTLAANYSRSGSWGSWGSSGYAVPGTSGTFTFAPSSPYLAVGSVMRFRAGALDAYGNVRWSAPTAGTVVPYDDRSTAVVLAGTWTRPSTTGAWLGTTSVTGSGGTASLRVGSAARGTTTRFTVVATVSPTGGRVKAYVDGRYVTTFSTRGSSGVRRNVWSSALLGSGAHRLTLVQVRGSGWFRLDGIGVDRR